MGSGWNAIRLALGAALAAAVVLPGSAGADATPPSQDGFYATPASLNSAAPGTVFRSREVPLGIGSTGIQVLYRTTDQNGKPAATAATIVKPAGGVGPTRLVSYQTAYDGVADTCRPSFALQQGNSGANSIVTAQSALIAGYMSQGFTVVTSDYQGPSDDFGAGSEEGRGTLDAIRAAENQLGLDPASTQVGLDGYSGGSIASMWAAQQAPDYAPELNIVGVAAGGIPTDFAHNLDYIAGSPDWAGAIPAVGIGLARAYRIDLGKFLSDRGKEIAAEVSQGCLEPAAYPGLRFEDLLKPKYQDFRNIPDFAQAFNDSIMGRTGTPNVPLLMGVGNDDGTGDSVMIAKDVLGLAGTYCSRGLSVQYREYTGADHTAGFAAFAPDAVAFLQQRFAGLAPSSSCPNTGGNALDPLPTPAGKPRFTSGLKVRGLKRHKGRYRVLVNAPTSPLTDVKLSVLRKKKGRGFKLLRRSETLVGEVGFGAQRVQLPLRRRPPRGRYRVLASGRMQTADVTGSLKFRVR